jgi:hypothetical protein
MESTKITLKKEIAVFKVWHNHHFYNKENYKNPEISKKPSFDDFSGEGKNFFNKEENCLYISEQQEKQLSKNKVILNFFTEKGILFSQKRSPALFFDIYEKEGNFFLKTLQTNSVMHGYPLRESFELCPLLIDEPIRILINSKTWHSMSSRQESIYYEYDFVYEYIGMFENYEIKEEIYLVKQEVKNMKIIDLRKKLY